MVARVRQFPILHSEHADGRPVVTPTRIDTLHVKISHTGDAWHRFLLDGAHHNSGSWRTQSSTRSRTACGHLIGGYYALREESYDGELCKDGCFTALELVTAAERRAEREHQRELDAAKWQADKEEMERRDREERERGRQRLADHAKRHRRTAEQPAIPKSKPDSDDDG